MLPHNQIGANVGVGILIFDNEYVIKDIFRYVHNVCIVGDAQVKFRCEIFQILNLGKLKKFLF